MNDTLKTILFLSLSGSILALLLFVGRPLLKNKVSKAFSYYIWLLVLLRLAVPLPAPINITDILSHSEPQEVSNILPKQTGSPVVNITDQSVGIPTVVPPVQSMASQERQSSKADNGQTSAKTQRSFDLWDFLQRSLLWLWLTGAIVGIGWFFIAYAVFSRRIRRSCTAPHGDDIAVFECLRGNRRVRLFCSSHINTPMFIGIWRPVIVLPQFAYVHNGMEKELSHILRHELTHYKRKDVLYKWLVVAVTSLHWFNPLMILIRREIGRSCELACDEAVIRNMSAEEKRFYGNMLLSLAANRKLPAGIIATTLCEEKKELKERLISIKNYKKKSAWAVALTLILALLLTGCAAALGVKDESNGVTVQKTSSDQEEEKTGNQEEQTKSDAQTSNLQPLTAQDRYENGKMFVEIPTDFVNSFQDKMAAVTVPDARKGERAADIGQGIESWGNDNIIFLNSIPEQNIYLYGYYDKDDPGYGLILDVGQEQHIYAFPYRYMTNTTLAPDLSTSSDGSRIYVSCHTGGGTGVTVSELYVFQVRGSQIEPYYLDINELADRLSSKLTMSYDGESKKVTVGSDGRPLITDSLTTIGVTEGENVVPDSFYCGDQIWYSIDEDTIRVVWVPTLYTQEQPGAQTYLGSFQVSFSADISFTYNSNGIITDFDLGEAAANIAVTAQGDFDGNGVADYVSLESSTKEAVFTIDLGTGTMLTKSIKSSVVTWMAPFYNALMAGDFDGDGKDEIVFAPMINGSNYGAKELYILSIEGDELTTLPLDCIKNTAIAYEQPESLNEDEMCVGVGVVDTDNGQLLRVRRLINAQEDSAWYIDVRWNGKGWQIESMSTGSAYGEEPVYQYSGNVSVAGKQQKGNITVHKNQEADNDYIMDFTFTDSKSGEVLQQLQYKYPDDFMPGTIQEGSQILDINQDGNDDIMLDLGVYGWPQLYACFVYDASINGYVEVPEFDEHPFPEVLKEEGVVLFHGKDGATAYWVEKYRVEGNQLYLLGRLTKTLEQGQSAWLYKEQAMVDGVMTMIKENVTAAEIKNYDAWHMWN